MCHVMSFLEDSSSKSVGTITSKARTPQGIMGLAILRKTAWVSGPKLIVKSDVETISGTTYEPE